MSISLLAPPDADGSTAHRQTTRLSVSWTTVVVCAIAIAYVDGYWSTSLRGAVGAIELSQRPFTSWLRDSTLMLPLFVLAVVAALALTRRWVGRSHRELVQLSVAALLTIVLTSAVSIAGVATVSAYDYNIQASQLGQIHANHASTIAIDPGTVIPSNPGTCTKLCSARHATLMAHVRAVGYASIVLLITNLVLVVWVLALRGGRLWAAKPATPQVDAADTQPPVGAVLI
jgi:hypothetical protein